MEFNFEKLEVYQKGLDFVDLVFSICEKLPRDLQSSFGDQLKRASLSIVNNIAEGSGQSFPKKKINFYEISLNSARECIPMLTLLERRRLIGSNEHEKVRGQCAEICKMLVGLIKSVSI